MNRKKWKVKECNNPEAAREISEKLGIAVLFKVLNNAHFHKLVKCRLIVCLDNTVSRAC